MEDVISIATTQTIHVLQVVLQTVPVGTNLALLHFLWSILNGSFLAIGVKKKILGWSAGTPAGKMPALPKHYLNVYSRGAIFPGLTLASFAAAASRRSWTALRDGVWWLDDLLLAWRTHVQAEGQWEAHTYDGYRPVAVDISAFWRPRLRGWPGRYFNGIIGRLCGGDKVFLIFSVNDKMVLVFIPEILIDGIPLEPRSEKPGKLFLVSTIERIQKMYDDLSRLTRGAFRRECPQMLLVHKPIAITTTIPSSKS